MQLSTVLFLSVGSCLGLFCCVLLFFQIVAQAYIGKNYGSYGAGLHCAWLAAMYLDEFLIT